MCVSLCSYVEAIEVRWEFVVEIFMVKFGTFTFNMSSNVNNHSDLKSGDVCALYLLHVIVCIICFCNLFSRVQAKPQANIA